MSSPRKRERAGTRGYAHLAEIRAPLNRVWRALTDPSLIRIWSGLDAEIDPRKNGLYRIGHPDTGGREAHIDVFQENRRLRLIYLPEPGMPRGDTAVVDDFLLDVPRADGIVSLRLLGSGIPETKEWDRQYLRLRLSAERGLGKIKNALENPPRPRSVPKPLDPHYPDLEF